MRLLNTITLKLELFSDNDVPRYAILSHTWGNDEVTFDILTQSRSAYELDEVASWAKVRNSCAVASELNFNYIWIDTCCIDKASSAELSEAINSMFRWYEQAQLCIAFLADVEPGSIQDVNVPDSSFRKSRWFTRGWTLQELIAPSEVHFYSREWTALGTRNSLKSVIRSITGVPVDMLEEQPAAVLRRSRVRQLDGFSVAQRMNWAACRVTTRAEDIAYCLLGIFDINMPLLYGEGREKAFKRLQEEIIRSTDDETIYAWNCSRAEATWQHYWGLLAKSPSAFGNYNDMMPMRPKYLTRQSNHAATMSNRGIHVELALTPFPNDPSNSIFFAFLDCEMRWEGSTATVTPAILLQKTSWDNDTEFVRIRPDMLAQFMLNRIVMPDELAEMMDDKGKPGAAGVLEASPRPIFVPHNMTVSRLPTGIIFHPEIHDSRGMTLSVRVLSRSPTWQHFVPASTSGPGEFYEIGFHVVSVPEVADLHEAKIFGVVEFEWPPRSFAQSSASSFSSSMSSSAPSSLCLVTGLEPLPTNPFETPPLYFAPWCAFESQKRMNDGSFERVLNKILREDSVSLDRRLQASLDLESRNSRLYYRVDITAHDVEDADKKAKRRAWFSTR